MKFTLLSGLPLFLALGLPLSAATGWLNWRGPNQNSVSTEKGLPTQIDVRNPLWSDAFPGQSTPVIAGGRLYINGYLGDGPDLQEVVRSYDAETGKLIWEHRENDFASDTIYLRYATSSPSVDPETGHVYVQFTQGLLIGFTAEGRELWRHSMMEEFGRLTFPNSRTATPAIDGDLVITRGITSAWGAHGAAGDRFYAFDKKSGQLVWSSAPGDRPQDNTFSNPYFDIWDGKRVLYSAGGDSSILALNARTGEPLWRFPFAKAGAKGGINASLIRYKDSLIALHESENLDSSEIGRMASFRIPSPTEVRPTNSVIPHVFPGKTFENWRNGVGSLASSPLLVGSTIYEITGTGDLAAIQADTGAVLWKKKLGIEQRQSTPFYADGLLYVTMYVSSEGVTAGKAADPDGGANGDLFILKPNADGVEEVGRMQLRGRCFGSPVGYNGKIYIQTDKTLYAFGRKGANLGLPLALAKPSWPKAGAPTQLQITPYEILVRPGQTQSFRIRTLDAAGFTVSENVDPKSVSWESYVPPTALVRAFAKATFTSSGKFVADPAPGASAGQFKATLKLPNGSNAVGFIKSRILPAPPLTFNFENFALTNKTTNTMEPPTSFAYPPLSWNSARFRWEVRNWQMDGNLTNQALVKTIDNKLFQRGQLFFGFPDSKKYTIQADVLSEGNKRKMSEVGVINQRYLVILKGNSQEIEVNSNQERIKVSKPFKWTPNTWYSLKSRVDIAADGSGMIRGKAWKRGEPEPAAWTIEVPHAHAHASGSPGLFGFSPQEQRVAIDSVIVTPN